MGFWVKTGRAEIGCLFSFVKIATVAAAPNHFTVTFKYSTGLKIVSQIFVALTVLLFGNRYCSNAAAISGNPSSRAVLAKPGYMSVHSCSSPAVASLRFSRVVFNLPAGKLSVISTLPPSRNLKKRLACSFS